MLPNTHAQLKSTLHHKKMEKNLKQIPLPLNIKKEIFLDIIHIKDTNQLFNIINSKREYLSADETWLNQCLTVDSTRAYIERSLLSLKLSQSIRLGIFNSCQLIGSILVTVYWDDHTLELGYWIDPNFQGKGLVTLSCKKILKIMRQEFSIKKAMIRCSAENLKSQAVAERLGFQKEDVGVGSQTFSNNSSDRTYCKILP